jgi:hypothetical protein
MVEIPEADLMYRDLPLVYHVPADMCRYLNRGTYWFYNEEIGVGPETIHLSTSKTVTVDASGTTTTTYSSNHDCTVDGVPDAGCDNQSELSSSVSSVDGSVTLTCKYNRSSEDHKHNCCLGEADVDNTITTYLQEPSGTTITSSPGAVTKVKWGGSVKDCIGGPGKTNWTVYDDDGYPGTVITPVEDGLDETYTITRPNAVLSLSSGQYSSETANYYSNTGAVDHTHTGYVSATTSALPYYIDPIDDRNGSTIYPGSPSYYFECLDSAYETIHRIRVYVREWDVRADFSHYVASGGTFVQPDRPNDNAPTDCAGLAGPCDDFWDHDDFLDLHLNLATYNTAAPLLRANNFPYLIYK